MLEHLLHGDVVRVDLDGHISGGPGPFVFTQIVVKAG